MTRNPFPLVVGDILAEAGQSSYEIISNDGESQQGQIASPINAGKAGVVYRARYKSLDRAVKILRPAELPDRNQLELADLIEQEQWTHFERTFQAEIRKLTQITHTNVAKITDYGICTSPAGVAGYPFYVMEYIEGIPFLDAVAGQVNSVQQLLGLFRDILDALIFLHTHTPRILHADVKSANVLVRKLGDGFQAILVDLGVAKFPDGPPLELFGDSEDSDSTYFFTTREITRDEFQPLIGTRVKYTTLRERLFPVQDLYAFGLLLKRALSTERVKSILMKQMDSAGQSALDIVTDQILSGRYKSAKEIRNALDRLHPTFLAPFGVAELSIAPALTNAIAIPGGRIRLSDRLAAVVQTPAFQRLRNLPQLNFASLLFPGATHTRFLHSLKTLSVATDYVAHLLANPHFRLLVNESDVEAALLLALLHDIGHYPLSHMFEDIREEEDVQGSLVDHLMDDDLIEIWIRPLSDDLENPVLAELREGFLREHRALGFEDDQWPSEIIAKVFSSTTHRRLIELGTGSLAPSDHSGRLLRAMIDGPADVDKIAYLMVDAEMTGVEYGRGIDLDAMFSSLRVPAPEEFDEVDGPVAAVTQKGVSAAESVVLARYWMITRVYWHHANRSVMAMVKFSIEVLAEAGAFDYKEYLAKSLFMGDTEALMYLHDMWRTNESEIIKPSSKKVREPILGLLGGQRGLYKRLLSISASGPAPDPEIYQRALKRGSSALGKMREAIEAALSPYLDEEIQTGDVLVDIPHKSRERTRGSIFVYYENPRQRPHSLFDSPVLEALEDEFDKNVKKLRIFVHPTIRDFLRSTQREDAARTDAYRALCQSLGIKRVQPKGRGGGA